MTRLIFAAAAAALSGVFFGPTAQAYEAPWCAMVESGTGSVYWASIPHSKTATAEVIFWQAIAAFVIRARTTSPTPQNTDAQRNAALAGNSGATQSCRSSVLSD